MNPQQWLQVAEARTERARTAFRIAQGELDAAIKAEREADANAIRADILQKQEQSK